MDLHKLYLSEQLEGIKSGKFSSTELTTHYLERISKFDEDLNSFITVTEENLREELLKNAPSVQSGLFLVPKVIEGEE